MTKTAGIFLLLLNLLILNGCTSQEELALMKLQESARQAQSELERLAEHIDKGHIANTQKLTQYANIVKASAKSPELRELIDTLAMDATSKGPLYSGLLRRLGDAKDDLKKAKDLSAINELSLEFASLREASSMDNYGWMLTDPINVLADMSDGHLPRMEAMSKEASLRANGAQDYGTGSQLVGNPTYGNWQTNSSGQSFWAWYGQYALFSSLFHRPIYYGGWAGSRDYSYYHEAGRYQYTSPNQKKAQQTVQQSTKQKFEKSGKSFSSPYAKTQTGSARAKAQAQRSSNSFNSAYASSRRSTSQQSVKSVNSRNSSSRNSRSYSSRGK